MKTIPTPEDTEEQNTQSTSVYQPDGEQSAAIKEVMDTFIKARTVLNSGYGYFGGRNLMEAIDDWTKRWNGYIPPMSPLLDQTQSNIFINFTRNAVISYLSKVAMSPVKSKIIAVNKKNGSVSQKFAEFLEDLNTFSLRAENGDKKFLNAAMECAVKGTVVIYEGYAKVEQKMKSPMQFDPVNGKLKWKSETRTIFDNCYQEVIPLEDFFILNPYEADVQKQPKVIWRKITTWNEVKYEFGHYKDFEYVRGGTYFTGGDVQTFYRQNILTVLQGDQVEVLRYYDKTEGRHIVIANGIVLYDGPFPWKDGKYPFAKGINEPFAVDFFWGNGNPNKYMGEQDLINTFINAMADKTINSLVPTGLSSDLDDLIEDDAVQMGKIRKVGDIEKWKWWQAPEVGSGEINMFNQIMTLAQQSGATDAGSSTTPRGGRLQTRQVLLKQQELMSKLSFNMTFLEDLERDRTELRISHILQFYSIPRIEKITGKRGKEIEELIFRDINLTGVKLSDGRTGNKVIKLISDEYKNPDSRAQLADELSVIETRGDLTGTPTEALAVSIDTFMDFNNTIQIVKFSSYEKNRTIEQAMRTEFTQARVALGQFAPVPNPKGLIDWWEDAYDIDTEDFETPPEGGNPLQPANPVVPAKGGEADTGNPSKQIVRAGNSGGIGI